MMLCLVTDRGLESETLFLTLVTHASSSPLSDELIVVGDDDLRRGDTASALDLVTMSLHHSCGGQLLSSVSDKHILTGSYQLRRGCFSIVEDSVSGVTFPRHNIQRILGGCSGAVVISVRIVMMIQFVHILRGQQRLPPHLSWWYLR